MSISSTYADIRSYSVLKIYLFAVLFLLPCIEASAQDSVAVNKLFESAMQLYKGKKIFEAAAEFQKVIESDPNCTEALYTLALINSELGDDVTAIRLLRQCVRLDDKRAVSLLRDRFHQKISYADTMQNIALSTSRKFQTIKNKQFLSLKDFTTNVVSISASRKEQLQILLLWAYSTMRADENRFFNGGAPLSAKESFQNRMGLCDEFSEMVSEFCNVAKIPCFRVTGYVKYPNYEPGTAFGESNHAWNAVFLDSTWVLCDLFWSITALDSGESGQLHFVQRLETDYFLANPSAFICDHLPSDPVFQFQFYPIAIEAFTSRVVGIDITVQRMDYLNYADSIETFSKGKIEDQVLRSANHSFIYNKNNPNELVTENFNYGVMIVNKKTSTKAELLKARACFNCALSVIDLSGNVDVKALKDNCKSGLTMINKRLTQLH